MKCSHEMLSRNALTKYIFHAHTKCSHEMHFLSSFPPSLSSLSPPPPPCASFLLLLHPTPAAPPSPIFDVCLDLLVYFWVGRVSKSFVRPGSPYNLRSDRVYWLQPPIPEPFRTDFAETIYLFKNVEPPRLEKFISSGSVRQTDKTNIIAYWFSNSCMLIDKCHI